jgi:hypothetical protein
MGLHLLPTQTRVQKYLLSYTRYQKHIYAYGQDYSGAYPESKIAIFAIFAISNMTGLGFGKQDFTSRVIQVGQNLLEDLSSWACPPEPSKNVLGKDIKRASYIGMIPLTQKLACNIYIYCLSIIRYSKIVSAERHYFSRQHRI